MGSSCSILISAAIVPCWRFGLFACYLCLSAWHSDLKSPFCTIDFFTIHRCLASNDMQGAKEVYSAKRQPWI